MGCSIGKKFAVAIIVISLIWLGVGYFQSMSSKQSEESGMTFRTEETTESVSMSGSPFLKKAIYTCRLGQEEVPGVQIFELTNTGGESGGIGAEISGAEQLELIVPDAVPVWDYKALSATSEYKNIKISYDPINQKDQFDWVLTLSSENLFHTRRVRDCQEISDE
jgi:hypothetical protein